MEVAILGAALLALVAAWVVVPRWRGRRLVASVTRFAERGPSVREVHKKMLQVAHAKLVTGEARSKALNVLNYIQLPNGFMHYQLQEDHPRLPEKIQIWRSLYWTTIQVDPLGALPQVCCRCGKFRPHGKRRIISNYVDVGRDRYSMILSMCSDDDCLIDEETGFFRPSPELYRRPGDSMPTLGSVHVDFARAVRAMLKGNA